MSAIEGNPDIHLEVRRRVEIDPMYGRAARCKRFLSTW
jgi:hypothetical protein